MKFNPFCMPMFHCKYCFHVNRLPVSCIQSSKHISTIFSSLRREFEFNGMEVNDKTFKMILLSALKSLHGDHGSAATIDVLKYCPKERRAYLRISSKHFVIFSTALTLVSGWEDKPCKFTIHKITHSLTSLPIESFHQQHNVIDP